MKHQNPSLCLYHGVQGVQEQEDSEDCCETASSGQDRALAPYTLTTVVSWVRHDTPSQCSSMDEKGVIESQPQLKRVIF